MFCYDEEFVESEVSEFLFGDGMVGVVEFHDCLSLLGGSIGRSDYSINVCGPVGGE